MEHTAPALEIVDPATSSGFFLNNILTARIALKLETGCHGYDDQDTNVYLAGLFSALMGARGIGTPKPYISPYDNDVADYLEHHPGTRSEFVVYKDNADFGLMTAGVFMGHHHDGSYHSRVLGEQRDEGRISFYYRLAASALEHLRGNESALVDTMAHMSSHVEEFVQIVRKVAGDYFDFIAHISGGSLFHLEHEVDALVRAHAYHVKMDEFLAHYSRHRSQPSIDTRDAVLRSVQELRVLNPKFSFDETSLAAVDLH